MNPSPLRYPGGKHKLYPYVAKLIEINDCTTYIEPFCGKCCTYEEEVFSHFMKTLFIPYIKSKYNEVNQNERKAENRCT